MTRGRKTAATRLEELRVALRFLHDPIALEEHPFADLPFVQMKAEREFQRRTCSVGLALAATLSRILEELAEDLCGTAVAELAAKIEAGATHAEAARQLGISREHLTRRWKPVLLVLVLKKLDALNQEATKLTVSPTR